MTIGASLKGRITAQVLDSSGRVKREVSNNNTILNQGFDLIGRLANSTVSRANAFSNAGVNGNNLIFFVNRCYIGSGNTAVQFTDTSLQSLVTSTTTKIITPTTIVGEEELLVQFEFPFGTINSNIQEFAFGPTGTTNGFPTNPLFSRIVLDTPLSVTSEDQLRIFYTLTASFPTISQPFEMLITGLGTFIGNTRLYSYLENTVNGYNFLSLVSGNKRMALINDAATLATPVFNLLNLPSIITYDGTNNTLPVTQEATYNSGDLQRDLRFGYLGSANFSNAKGFFIFPNSDTELNPSVMCKFDGSQVITKDLDTLLNLWFRIPFIRG